MEALKTHKICYWWEYPEGISFTFNGKKQRCRHPSEAETFWERNKKKLKAKRPEPDEEEKGAVGGRRE